MKLHITIKQAIRSLMANKGRSFLTSLGIIIGIGSVVGLISLGAGVQDSINKQVGSLGSRNLTVMPGEGFGDFSSSQDIRSTKRQQTQSSFNGNQQTLTSEDLQALKDISDPSISAVSGSVSGSSVFEKDGTEVRKTVTGVSPEYFSINEDKLESGTFFTQDDNQNKKKVAVVGNKFATDILGSTDVVGNKVTIADNEFTIVGVLENANESSFLNPNNQVYIPDQTALEVFDTQSYGSFTVQASSDDMVDQAKSKIEETLLSTHGIEDKSLADFSVTSAKDLLATIDQITSLLTSFLAGIAAISLVVGGIGIMNIMLVSVTERTREIGLRKAVGAKTFDIMIQFTVEAVLLTLIGGLFGTALGYGIGLIAHQLVSDITPVVTANTLLLAVGVSSFIGIVFGVYPATKAAKLNPIDALRYE